MTAEDALKAIEQHEQPIEVPREAKETLREILNTRYISEPQPTKEDIMNNIHLPNPDAIQYTHGGTLGAPEPQPSQVNPEAVIEDMIAKFSISLKLLLTTIISQPKAQPEEGTNVPTLQDCVEQVLVQAEWFEELVKRQLEALDIAVIAKDAVQEVVECEVDAYFENCFDVSNHFDFDDAVHDAVGDRIDDVVSDKIDDAVDAYLSNATISISK
jgi:hypothetical protein